QAPSIQARGLPESIPEWGGDLQQALTALPTGIWWTALFPGLALFVLVLGLAYKADVDDDRESPAYVLMRKLEEKGAQVDYHDPYVPVIRMTREHPEFAGKKSVGINHSCDLILIVTAHESFRKNDFSKAKVPVVDTRNCIEPGKRPKKYFRA
ncbi:MAG: hypothetical protein EBZ07_07495, partial [Verrucomicrobia bacterium]|nr:hypothetical protein [Verrucomicrobiota bacterium]